MDRGITDTAQYKDIDSHIKSLESMIHGLASGKYGNGDPGSALVHAKALQRFFDGERRKFCGE